MTKLLLFLLIIAYNAVQGWLLENTSLESVIRILTFAGDAGMAFLALTSLKRNISFYGWRMFLAFILVSTFTLVYNFDRTGFAGHLNGLRLPLFFFTSLIVVYDIFGSEHRERFEKYFTVFLFVFAVLQIPSSFVQFKQYGPSDFVGGTLGWGGTNVVTLALFLIVFYFILKFGSSSNNTHFRVPMIIAFSLLLFPCAINETKISFVFIAIFVLLLADTRRLYIGIPVLLLGIALLYVFNILYSEYIQDTGNLLDISFLEKYLFYNEGVKGDVPRFEKLALTLNLMSNDPTTYFFGLGYGLFMGSHFLKATAFGFNYDYLTGARMFINTVWLEGGILAVLCIFFPLFHFIGSRNVLSFNMKRFKWFLCILLLSMWFYHDSLYNRAFAGIVSYLILWTEMGGIDREAAEYGDDTEEGEHSVPREMEDETITYH